MIQPGGTTRAIFDGRNVGLCHDTADLAGGDGCVAIRNAASAPSGTPSNGGVLYASAGNLFWRNSAGVSTRLNYPLAGAALPGWAASEE